MIKKIIFFVLIAIVFSCVIYGLVGLRDYHYSTNFSSNIQKSKQEKVFICKYDILPDSIFVNGNVIKFDEVWLEKSWHYGRKDSIITGSNQFELIIHINKGSLDSLAFPDWYSISNNDQKFFGILGHDRLSCYFDSIPSDKMVWQIKKAIDTIRTIRVGEFTLVRKL